jgi:hypothetical protein
MAVAVRQSLPWPSAGHKRHDWTRPAPCPRFHRRWRGPLRRSPSRGGRPNYPPRPSVNIPAACIFTSAAVPAGDIAAILAHCDDRASLTRPAQPAGSCRGRYQRERQPPARQDTTVCPAGSPAFSTGGQEQFGRGRYHTERLRCNGVTP